MKYKGAMTKQLTPLSYFDVLEACRQPGCPFCRLSDETVANYLSAVLYESITDPQARDELRGSLGFCADHAWRLPEQSGAALGVAILYRDLARHSAAMLEAARYQRGQGMLRRAEEALDREKPAAATAAAARSLAPQAPCPACQQRDRMEAIALQAM